MTANWRGCEGDPGRSYCLVGWRARNQPPVTREDQRHSVIDNLVDKGIGAIGDRDALLRRRRDELVLGARPDLENLGVDRRQRLHLVAIISGGRVAGAGRRRDPEFGQGFLRLRGIDAAADHNLAEDACQSRTTAGVAGCEIEISESTSVITNKRESPATTPTRLIANANIACVPM